MTELINPLSIFKTDCFEWNGYKPCQVQKKQGYCHCGNCPSYQPTENTPKFNWEQNNYSPDLLRTAQTIGIVEFGGLGSHLRTSAVVKAIQDINKDTEIYWFTYPEGAEVVSYIPGVTPIILEEFEPDKNFALDVLINFEINPIVTKLIECSSTVAGFSTNAVNKFGPASEHAYYFQRMQIDDMFRIGNQLSMQEILLKTIGLDATNPEYHLALSESNHSFAVDLLQNFNINAEQKLIGLNIGTSQKGMLKRWPPEKYINLIHFITKSSSDTVFFIFSGPEDADIKEAIKKHLDTLNLPNVYLLPSDMEVGNFMATLSRMNLVVASDTFAAHVAFATKVPTIVLSGPMPKNEIEAGKLDTVISQDLPCGPCYYRCQNEVLGECMHLILPMEVATIAIGMLGIS